MENFRKLELAKKNQGEVTELNNIITKANGSIDDLKAGRYSRK